MRGHERSVDMPSIPHLILSPSKDEVGRIVRSSWFDGLTMTTHLILGVSIFLFAHATSLTADESTSFQLGSVVISLPGEWTEGGHIDGQNAQHVMLEPPVFVLDGAEGISTSEIDYVSILLHDATGNVRGTVIEFPLAHAAETLAIARPEDAAIAFDGIAFDTLRGGPSAAAGKSISWPLILVGSVTVTGYGSVVIKARIDRSDGVGSPRAYTISAMFEAKGHPFAMMIGLILFRPLRSSDLALVDFVADTIAAGIAD